MASTKSPPTAARDAAGSLTARIRRLAPARAAVRSWRELTGGRPTLIACSGGADSTALAIALAGGRGHAIAHIVHDMRPASEANVDRDAVRELAGKLGLPFHESQVSCRDDGNVESAARRARYRALERIARDANIAFVASAHHADDQFESLVMALIRGAGLRGLSGIAPSRPLSDSVTLVRPMLRLTRADSEAICRAAGIEWVHDRTNLDETRARAGLRLGPIAQIRDHRPGAALRAAKSADLLRDAAQVVEERVIGVFGDADQWPRARLRTETALVVGAGLRRAALRVSGGIGADRLTARIVDPVVRAVRDNSTEPRRFTWSLSGTKIEVRVTAQNITLRATREG